MSESAIFAEHPQAQKRERAPIVEALSAHGLTLTHLFTASLLFAAGFYLLFAWLPTYLSAVMEPAEKQAELFNTIAIIALMGCLPLAGLLSDRFGKRTMLLLGGLSFVVLSLPRFIGLHSGLWWPVLAIQIAFALIMALIQSTIPATMVEMFETRIRYTGMALGYNLVFAVFGGTAPLVWTWLLQTTGQHLAPAYYIVGLGIVSLGATITLRPRVSRTADRRS